MQKHTAIGDALAANGVTRLNVKFQLAIAEFQNNGGEYGVALAMLNAAYGKGSKATALVPSGQNTDADASRQNGDTGRYGNADKAGKPFPASSPVSSEGHHEGAEKVGVNLPSVAKRMPGHAKRGAIEIAAVQDAISRSLFDTTVLPDGRRLREVRWSECPALATKYRKLSRIFMAVHNFGVPADASATIDNVVSEKGLEEIIGAVERFNDIH